MAPGALQLVEEFVNTLDLETGTETLDADWLAAHDLGADDIARARAVREALRALLLAHNGRPLDPAAVRTLDAEGRGAGLAVRFDDGGHAALAAPENGLARLFAIVAHAEAEGTWARMKACPDAHCAWAFYDSTRNRSRTWCDMAICGNRAKARAFRARRAQTGSA
jgi:predicted RNA-binding Zn ribbon-like protein